MEDGKGGLKVKTVHKTFVLRTRRIKKGPGLGTYDRVLQVSERAKEGFQFLSYL